MQNSNKNKIIIRFIRLSTIVHATEDIGKIYETFSHISPKQLFPHVSEEKKVKGHHGNEIRTVTLKLSNRNTMQRFLEHFWRQLSTLDREQILSLLPQLVDEKNVLHLRLDKQELFLGNPRLGGEDPVKIEIGFNWLPKPQLEKIEHLKMLFIQLDEHMRV